MGFLRTLLTPGQRSGSEFTETVKSRDSFLTVACVTGIASVEDFSVPEWFRGVWILKCSSWNVLRLLTLRVFSSNYLRGPPCGVSHLDRLKLEKISPGVCSIPTHILHVVKFNVTPNMLHRTTFWFLSRTSRYSHRNVAINPEFAQKSLFSPLRGKSLFKGLLTTKTCIWPDTSVLKNQGTGPLAWPGRVKENDNCLWSSVAWKAGRARPRVRDNCFNSCFFLSPHSPPRKSLSQVFESWCKNLGLRQKVTVQPSRTGRAAATTCSRAPGFAKGGPTGRRRPPTRGRPTSRTCSNSSSRYCARGACPAPWARALPAALPRSRALPGLAGRPPRRSLAGTASSGVLGSSPTPAPSWGALGNREVDRPPPPRAPAPPPSPPPHPQPELCAQEGALLGIQCLFGRNGSLCLN